MHYRGPRPSQFHNVEDRIFRLPGERTTTIDPYRPRMVSCFSKFGMKFALHPWKPVARDGSNALILRLCC